MYHIQNIIKALQDHRSTFRGATPQILCAAMQVSQDGLLSSGSLNHIFLGNQNWVQMFRGLTEGREHVEIFVAAARGGGLPLDVPTLLFLLCGGEQPEWSRPFLTGQKTDVTEFNQLLREHLKERGVDWDIHIEFEGVLVTGFSRDSSE